MKKFFNEPIYFLSAKRTAFGAFLGSLKDFSATDLGVLASKAALNAISLNPNKIDQVIFGNVLQTAKDAIYLARHIALKCDMPETTPALTINRLCGSGFEAIIQGARLLATKEAHCVLVGGSESMSQAPHIIRGARLGFPLGKTHMEDSLFECLSDSFIGMPMGLTAENLAEKYQISQDEVDDYSVMSQERYQKALSEGIFDDELHPIDLPNSKTPSTLFSKDEHPRKNTTKEKLLSLPKIFKKGGVIHAAAASGICDGAAALIVCSEKFLLEHRQKPLGELISFGISGCDPKIMGIGPVDAIKIALEKASTNLHDVNMIEVNEAFAPQVLAVKKALDLDINRLNIHGGAIAIGHPLAASGARIVSHLLHHQKRRKESFSLGSACIGGGQGIAVLLKSF